MIEQETSGLRREAQRLKYYLTLPEKWFHACGAGAVCALPLPDFIGIGAMKAGSTWLFEMLRLHPELYLAQPKEAHYFDRRFHRTVWYYSRRFRAGQGLVKGEITPTYATLSVERIRYIQKLLPNLRVVYLIRHPVSRAWSQAEREVLRARRRRIEDVAPEDFYSHFRSAASRENSNYTENLRRWRQVFPDEQVFVGFTDEIKRRPHHLLTEIFGHLGVSTAVDPKFFPVEKRVNARGKHPIPPEYREYLTSLYADEIERLRDEFRDRVGNWPEWSAVEALTPTAANPPRATGLEKCTR